MLSTPAVFESARTRSGQFRSMVLKLTDGSSTWYFSLYAPIRLTEGLCHPLISNSPVISNALSIQSKECEFPDVKVKLYDVPFYRDPATGIERRASDVLSGIRNHAAELYLVAGTPTALSDCLKRFVGVVGEDIEYDGQTMTIPLISNGKFYDVLLPDNLVSAGDAAWSPTRENRYVRIPLIYGEFTKSYDSAVDTGLCVGVKVTDDKENLYVFADHIIKEATAAYGFQRQLKEVSKYISPTMDADDSGRATVKFSGEATAIMFAENADQGDYAFTFDGVRNAQFAGDGDSATYAKMVDTTVGSNVWGYAAFAFYDADSSQSYFINPIGRITGRLSGGTRYIDVYYKVERITLLSSVTAGPDLYLYYNTGASYLDLGALTLSALAYSSFAIDEANINWKTNVAWHPRSGKVGNTGDYPIIAMLVYNGSFASTDYPELMRIFHLYLSIQYKPYHLDGGYLACKGKTFGSWIDAGGRSNSYSSGDMIEDPAFIIEDMARDYVGVPSANIDTASFDAAANSSVKARINLHSGNMKTFRQILRELSEQSTFIGVWTDSGNLRLVPLNDTSPTTNRIIPWFQIKADSLTVSIPPVEVNRMEVDSRYMQEYAAFRDKHFHGADAEGGSGVAPLLGTFQWPNICGTSRSHVAEHYVNVTNGIWFTPHVNIELETAGYINSDLEIGDWIELDSVSVDPHILCFGSSWSGRQFLVVGIEQGEHSTKIKALELYA